MSEQRTKDGHRWGEKARAVRIDDELWAAAKARADKAGVTMASVLRGALQRYTSKITIWSLLSKEFHSGFVSLEASHIMVPARKCPECQRLVALVETFEART